MSGLKLLNLESLILINYAVIITQHYEAGVNGHYNLSVMRRGVLDTTLRMREQIGHECICDMAGPFAVGFCCNFFCVNWCFKTQNSALSMLHKWNLSIYLYSLANAR